MPLDSIDEQLAFLELTEQDCANLAALRPALEKRADDLVAAFYRHLIAFAPTRDLLADPAVKARLLAKQREYLLSLAGPRLDADYFAERIAIGRRHVEVGLEPRWYLGAYSLHLKLLLPLIRETFSQDPALAQRTTSSLFKVLALDSQLAMGSYIEERERQLEYLNRELAEAGRSLERELGEQTEELRETSARAHAAEQLASVGTIVAGLAHEIGTPMGVIQGHAELLESSVKDARGRKRLGTIRDQIERISHIIQTLLNMARPVSPERTLVPLNQLIDDTLAFVQEKFLRREILARTDHRARATLLGNPEKLQQLFLNLFINAADAMLDGGELIVTVEGADSGRPEVVIRVMDTGHGIPENIRERMFEPFFTTKAAGRGSGLGLMVVEGIVVDHGGSIEVNSSPGEGAEIVMNFPCRELGEPEAASA